MPIPPSPDGLEAAWLEDVLREGSVFPNARVRRIAAEIIGVGFGLGGTSVRVTIDGDETPATLVVKWASAQNARCEERFYRAVAPRLERGLEQRLASLLGARIDESAKRGVLVLSDVAPARQGDTLIGATPTEADALIDAMAGYHALYWGPEEVPGLAPLPRWAGGGDGSTDRLVEVLPRFLAEWADRLSPAAIAFAAELPDRTHAARDSLAQSPRTLIHADLHLDNVLFLEDGVPVVLDWPSACCGPAAVDFTLMLVEGMTSSVRRAHQERLMLRHLAALESSGVRYDVDRMRADVACVMTRIYEAAVLWVTGPNATRKDVPRVALLAESLVRKSADAITGMG